MQPITARHWNQRGPEPSPGALTELARELGIQPLTAQVLLLRGIAEVNQGREFLQGRLAGLPDPALMLGMPRAVARLVRALASGERLAVHGDYDVDGISGTALLVETLRNFGATVDYYIPLRLKDGYGLSAEALHRAAGLGTTVAISVDCGVSAVAEARLAQELGIDLIITDHHHPPEHLPEAYAILNPQLPGCNFPFKSLAGVGVAFMLLVALRQALRLAGAFVQRPEPDLRRSLDLVALGTIADIVPLTGVNRVLTKAGLALINSGERPGLVALKTVAGVKQASCGSVGFNLAPRLNAAGRLEDAALGVQLLLTRSAAEAQELVEVLDRCNRERQQIEQETLRQAIERLEEGGEGGATSIVLADGRWHAGVIGIVASRLVERYHRPTVLIALEGDQGKGSARSAAGLHLYQAFQRCQEWLTGFGGHAFAAGLSIAGGKVAPFAAAFEAVATELIAPEALVPQLSHDGEVQLEELERGLVDELAELTPFGAGNPEPVFLLRGVRAQQLRQLGETHLRFTARQGGFSLPCIAFGMAGRSAELAGEVDLLVIPQLNEWQGSTSVQLRIKDMRPAEA